MQAIMALHNPIKTYFVMRIKNQNFIRTTYICIMIFVVVIFP